MTETMTHAEAVRVLRCMVDAAPHGAPRWTRLEDDAVNALSLDADNYRARDNDDWPAHLRGRLTEPTMLAKHLDDAEASARVLTLQELADVLRVGSDGVDTYEVRFDDGGDGGAVMIVAPVVPNDDRCAACRCGSVTIRVSSGGFVVVIAGEDGRDGARSVPLTSAEAVLQFVRHQGWAWCVADDEPGDVHFDEPTAQATPGALLDAAQLAAETAVERAGGLDAGDPRAVLAAWLLQDAADAAHGGESDPTRLLPHEATALQLMYRTLIASRTGIEQARA